MCAIDDADPCTLYHAKTVRARTAHRCEECGRTIQPGEEYGRATMLCDGTWSSFASCAQCQVAQEWLIAQCGGFLHGYTLEDLHEHWVEGDLLHTNRFARLIVAARRNWRDHHGHLYPPTKLKEMLK